MARAEAAMIFAAARTITAITTTATNFLIRVQNTLENKYKESIFGEQR